VIPATRPRAFPLLTATVAGVTAVVSVTGLLVEPVLLALRRDPVPLAAGQLWRLLTALLVQDGGAPGTVLNLLGLVFVGLAAERRLGRLRWSLGYLAGGLTGELVGWAGWQPVVPATRWACAGWPGRSRSRCSGQPTRRAGWPPWPRPPGR